MNKHRLAIYNPVTKSILTTPEDDLTRIGEVLEAAGHRPVWAIVDADGEVVEASTDRAALADQLPAYLAEPTPGPWPKRIEVTVSPSSLRAGHALRASGVFMASVEQRLRRRAVTRMQQLAASIAVLVHEDGDVEIEEA